MQLNLKALAIAFAILWGGSALLVGVAHELWPGYGGGFLEMLASIYPGYTPGGYGAALVGTLYAALDGAICGALIAWLYNAFSGRGTAAAR